VRAVLDPNVLISAITGSGPPARIVAAWSHGEVDLVLSEQLLTELEEVLARPKPTRRVPPSDAEAFVELLRQEACLVDDPPAPRHVSVDPDDDYLVALAGAAQAVLVSGDDDLLDLAPELPVMSPRTFLTQLEST
jgi:putative PIN family toxin of toxin-antitoxin system